MGLGFLLLLYDASSVVTLVFLNAFSLLNHILLLCSDLVLLELLELLALADDVAAGLFNLLLL